MNDFQTWLADRGIDCERLVPELLKALTAQYEADCQRLAPVTERLVATADCPPRVHRIVQQPTLFDMRAEYQ